MATPLKCDALVAYFVHVVRSNFIFGRRTNLINHGYTLLVYLPVVIEGVETEDIKKEQTWVFRSTGLHHWRVKRLKY